MASEDIERLRQAALKDPVQSVKLADALVAQDRADEAVAVCRKALAARTDDIALRLALGRALSAAGRFEEAQAALLDAVSRQQKAKAAAPTPAQRHGTLPMPMTPTVRPPGATDNALPSFEMVESDEVPTGVMDSPPTVEEPPRRRRAFEDTAPTDLARETPIPPPVRRYDSGEERLPPREEYVPPPRPRTGTRGGLSSSEDSSRRSTPAEPSREPQGPHDLDEVAEMLLGPGVDNDTARDWGPESLPAVEDDPIARAWDERRARTFVWLWVGLGLLAVGIGAGWIWRARERAKLLAATVERADSRTLEATFEGDLAARDAYASALRAEPHTRTYFAMVALADARLSADQGEDTDAAAWAMMKRAEKEQKRHPTMDPRADRELRQMRALQALARGEACTPTVDAEDADIAARCDLQRGDVDGARRVLAQTIQRDGEGKSIRALLTLGSLELGAGDLDAADAAYGKVLALYPQHPRALVGRALVSLERNDLPTITIPQARLGATTEAWFHLAAGLSALGRRAPEAQASYELDLARKGLVHDGRLALLYGRARLMQGRVADAEEAMRVAERLDPNDGDVAVLDAEVALAKGFEDKVASALAARPPTPRSLAVLGRALCLTGKYREAAATLDAALARRPTDAVALTYRAITRAHLGDSKGAISELEKAARSLSSTAPYYGIGLLAYERHDLLKARAELSRALEHNSESFRAGALLGRVLRDLGKPKEALAQLDNVVRQAPALMSARAARARLYLDLGRVREAAADARTVIDAGNSSPEDKLTFAEATIRLGRADAGEAALKDATDGGIPATRVARLRLVLQSWRGAKEAALAAKLLEKERHGPAAHDPALAIDTADAWRRAGDLRKAADDLRAALLGDGLHANLGLGRVQLLSNTRDEAEQSYRAALASWDRGPYGVDDQTEARIGLARVLLARDPHSKEAMTVLEAATKDDSNSAEAHYWLARVCSDTGDVTRARAQADKAVDLDDSYAEAFALDGELWRTGDRDKAKKALKKYLELAPQGEQAKQVRRALAQLK
jgi:tetratricopeptide (TPR) repeat protein